MVFDHIVKYKDVLYMAGENVPIDEKKPAHNVEQKLDATDDVASKKRGRPNVKRD
jgi:hypothetical protein